MCFVASFGIVLLVLVNSQQAQIIPENAYLTVADQQAPLDNRIKVQSVSSQEESSSPSVLDDSEVTRNETSLPDSSAEGDGKSLLGSDIDAYARHTNANEEESKKEIIEQRQPKLISTNIDGDFVEHSPNDDDNNGKFEAHSFDNSIFQDESFQFLDQQGVTFDKVERFNLFTASRPSNVSRQESPHYPWGSHAFGPLEVYELTPHGLRWNAYFYEQTIAVVLEDKGRTVLNCSLLEVIPVHENRAALRALGQVMALVPLNLRQMVVLASFCESAEERLAPRPNSRRKLGETGLAPERLFIHASTALMGILPGTVWCGLGDRASRYHQLGERRELDSCCRVHDHCPVKVRAGDFRYGYSNTGFSTVSHCLCDEAFRICLQKASRYDEVAPVIGNLFFNVLGTRCLGRPKPRKVPTTPVSSLVPPAEHRKLPRKRRIENLAAAQDDYYSPRLHCAVPDSDGGCRLWLGNPKSVPIKLEVVRPPFKFQTPRIE